jgi:PBP1b-binding outer membrane lipoprotein LpoB
MKSKFILFIATLALLSFSSVSCEEETTTDVSGGDACADEIEALSTILLQKTDALNSNPSSGNCQAYKTAWMNFYNKTKSCGYSTAQLEDAKEAVQGMDCSVFD